MSGNSGIDYERNISQLKGFKIRDMNYLMMIITSIVFALLITSTFKTYTYGDNLEHSIKSYVQGQQVTEDLRQVSDYLTEQTRMFVVEGNPIYIEDYFKEIKETKRLDKVMDYLYNKQSEDEEDLKLIETWFQRLHFIECKAMLLTAQAQHLDLNKLPQEITSIELNEHEKALSDEEKEKLALSLVFDTLYQDYKTILYNHLDRIIKSELHFMQEDMTKSFTNFRKSLLNQRLMIIVLFLVNVGLFAFIILLVIRPLNSYIKNIKSGSLIKIFGSYEFKYLALTYNDAYMFNSDTNNLLRYSSEHDNLTGVLNRTAFASIAKILKKRPIKLALMMIDIDKFKAVNDTYGHEIGDRIIKKVAKTLEDTMRSNDKIIRYGGDEFIVIMMDISPEFENVIERKIKEISQLLQNPIDGLPPATLSIGIAFSTTGYHEELLTNADKALYMVKENGRNGYKIFEKVL